MQKNKIINEQSAGFQELVSMAKDLKIMYLKDVNFMIVYSTARPLALKLYGGNFISVPGEDPTFIDLFTMQCETRFLLDLVQKLSYNQNVSERYSYDQSLAFLDHNEEFRFGEANAQRLAAWLLLRVKIEDRQIVLIYGKRYRAHSGAETNGIWKAGDYATFNGKFSQVSDVLDMEDLRQADIAFRPMAG